MIEREQALERAVKLAAALDPNNSTVAEERELAEAVIDVRQLVRTKTGHIDWTGTSGDAKSLSAEIYSAVNADAATMQKLKTRLRQHYKTIVPARMPAGALAGIVEDTEDVMSGDDFFDDLGVFIKEHGRSSGSSTQALQLVLAASSLIRLVDAKAVRGEGAVNLRVMLQNLADTLEGVSKSL